MNFPMNRVAVRTLKCKGKKKEFTARSVVAQNSIGFKTSGNGSVHHVNSEPHYAVEL
jgi:hypothetical protein